MNDNKRQKVVILGSGWAGYSFARTLDPAKFDRIVISPRGYFVFTPLLASTSVGTLEFRAVLEPVRRLPGGVRFYQGWADDVDFSQKVIRVEANAVDGLPSELQSSTVPVKKEAVKKEAAKKGEVFDVEYDKLVIAVGAYSQTFGIPGVREHAHFLRDVGDARRIRLRVLSLFEQCSYPTPADSSDTHVAKGSLSEADKRSLLHFVIVGGGPTGIEFAAELHDLIHEDLKKLYPELVPLVRITVYDIAPKVLPMFDQALAQYAMDTFARQGIQVRTEHHLERVRIADGLLGSAHGGMSIKIKEYSDEVNAGLVVWSTGLMQNPFVEHLVGKEFAVAQDKELQKPEDARPHRLVKDAKTGGILTDAYLRARITDSETSQPHDAAAAAGGTSSKPVMPDVFVIGDCAVNEGDRSLPKTAQVAAQQAGYLAKQLNKATQNGSLDAVDVGSAWKPFKFRNWGTLTYLGGWKAIHQSSADELRGWVAWVVWRGAYLTRSMSLRNKMMVPVYWFVSWVFGRDISRF
ncbi:FAD/NAD(P)-binding domain-containing protein [Trichoderma citrinoviride]|uniref:FAD/NAD(P)-binding domain-containing protein n=1 Tax=Trichoderma citrinoviride TaxID=58853 RepID=A0A2T4BA72_9HYPO|nr:FAD/NAD(P)-binding domain-containing protein [Trichoderma citrinoviride]PTB66233.1 FAD/NAD(P)-binding domain-containing protein [Trichoderma citrinoviride]